MKQVFFVAFLMISSLSLGQTCKDSVKYKFIDLSICLDSSMQIVGSDQQKIFIALNESLEKSGGKRKILQLEARLDFEKTPPSDIWQKEHADLIANAQQMATDFDTTYELNGNKFYWNESLAKLGEDKFFNIYTGILFHKNQYYLFKIGGATKDPSIKNHILNVISRCKIETSGIFETDYLLQRDLMENIVLSVQNEMRLKALLVDFETFYSKLPESEQNEENKAKLSGLFAQWQVQTKIYIRGMRQFEKIDILSYALKPDKSDDKMTIYNGEVAFQLDDKPFKAKVGAVKFGKEMFLIVVNSDQKPQKIEEKK